MSALTNVMDAAELQELSQNYFDHVEESESRTASITLDELRSFLNKAKRRHKEKFTSVEIYFVRYPEPNSNTVQKEKTEYPLTYFSPVQIATANSKTTLVAKKGGMPAKKVSQLAMVLVASKKTGRGDEWKAKNIREKGSQQLTVLSVCNPMDKNGTGLCPPQCGNGNKELTNGN